MEMELHLVTVMGTVLHCSMFSPTLQLFSLTWSHPAPSHSQPSAPTSLVPLPLCSSLSHLVFTGLSAMLSILHRVFFSCLALREFPGLLLLSFCFDHLCHLLPFLSFFGSLFLVLVSVSCVTHLFCLSSLSESVSFVFFVLFCFLSPTFCM